MSDQTDARTRTPGPRSPDADSPAQVRVRPARRRDAGLIAAFIHELARYERQPEDCHATAEAVQRQLFDRSPPGAECVIGEKNGVPAGFALFFHSFSTWECAPGLYLEDLYVRPEHRGQGVGKALFVHLARLARERGCARFEFSVLDWNAPSIAFYRAHGARPMTGWTVYRIDGDALAELGAPGPSEAG